MEVGGKGILVQDCFIAGPHGSGRRSLSLLGLTRVAGSACWRFRAPCAGWRGSEAPRAYRTRDRPM
jgi:hypothetical protein